MREREGRREGDLLSHVALAGSISWKMSMERRPWEVARIVAGSMLYFLPTLKKSYQALSARLGRNWV